MLLYTNRTQSPAIVVLSLFSCNPSQGETDASTGSTSSGSATDGPTTGDPTTGGDSGICGNSTPPAGGPCAPFGAIAAGTYHTCTLLFGGKIRCWGDNDFGQLGLGHVNAVGDDEMPSTSAYLDLGEAAIQIAAGFHHTCAVTEGGHIYCWGAGDLGRLGYGNTLDIGDDELPASAGPVALNGFAVQVAVGAQHTCALTGDGAVYCWGSGEFGQLGVGNSVNIGDDETPETQPAVDLGGRAVHISSSSDSDHTCAVLEDGGVICWGRGEGGVLGRANTENIGDDESPGGLGPIDLGAPAAGVATGANHTCALTLAGEVRCWGSGLSGALGYGNSEGIGDDEYPSAPGAVSVGRPAVAIAANLQRTCALLDDGTLKCWGTGVLGYGNTDSIGVGNVPSDFGPINVGGGAVQVAVGAIHTCALLAEDSIRCWGSGERGSLGYGNTGFYLDENSTCYLLGFGSVCDVDPVCCIGDMPGEMPPPPVQYQ